MDPREPTNKATVEKPMSKDDEESLSEHEFVHVEESEDVSAVMNRIAEASDFEKALVKLFLYSKKRFAEEASDEEATSLQRSYNLLSFHHMCIRSTACSDQSNLFRAYLRMRELCNLSSVSVNLFEGASEVERAFVAISKRDFREGLKRLTLSSDVKKELLDKITALFFAIKETVIKATTLDRAEDAVTTALDKIAIKKIQCSAATLIEGNKDIQIFEVALIAFNLLLGYLAVEEANASRTAEEPVPEPDNETVPVPGVSADNPLPSPGVSAVETVPAVSADNPVPSPGVSANETVLVPGVSADNPVPSPGVSANETVPVPGVSADIPLPSPGVSAVETVAAVSAHNPVPSPGVSANETVPVPGVSADNPLPSPGVSAVETVPAVSADNGATNSRISANREISFARRIDHNSRPFYWDLYLCVACHYEIITLNYCRQLSSRVINHHFTDNIAKSVVLLSFGYKTKILEHMSGVYGYFKDNLRTHNASLFLSEFVKDSIHRYPESSYRYLVLLSLISEVSLIDYEENQTRGPHISYLNKVFNYYVESGMERYEELLKSLDNFEKLKVITDNIAEAWERLGTIAKASYRMRHLTLEEITRLSFPQIYQQNPSSRVQRPPSGAHGGTRPDPEGRADESQASRSTLPEESETLEGQAQSGNKSGKKQKKKSKGKR